MMDDHRQSDPQPEKKDAQNEELNEETIIDLSEMIQPENDETIIDLQDVLQPREEEPDTTDKADEDAIPLLDVIGEQEETNPTGITEDTVIDLKDTVVPSEPAPFADSPGGKTATDDVEEGVIDLLEVREDQVPEADGEDAHLDRTETVTLTEQQLEAALTRVIEKVYGEKIEGLLIQTIEKTVRQEIERIQNRLLSDSEDSTG